MAQSWLWGSVKYQLIYIYIEREREKMKCVGYCSEFQNKKTVILVGSFRILVC